MFTKFKTDIDKCLQCLRQICNVYDITMFYEFTINKTFTTTLAFLFSEKIPRLETLMPERKIGEGTYEGKKIHKH